MPRRASALALLLASCSPGPGGDATPAAPPPTSAASEPGADAQELAELEEARRGALAAAAEGSPIKPDEEVLLFPTAASLDGSAQAWRVPIHGWIYEAETGDLLRAGALTGLSAALGHDPRFGSEAFLARARTFVRDNERDKLVPVELAGVLATCAPSGPDGHFHGAAEIPAARAGALAPAAGTAAVRIEVSAVPPAADPRHFTGATYLIPPAGLTIVSDIDDTVKVTEVLDRKKVLENTFLEPFRAVPGMAEAYQSWLVRAPGSHLHFVSSSPWQLYPALQEMLDAAGFPPATFDLKAVRLKDPSIAELFADPMETKRPAIENLIERFPGRRFALVGDSGERDPEVYGEVARRHPEHVVYIAIRDVTGESREAPRYAAAFRDVIAPWEVFTDPAALGGPR